MADFKRFYEWYHRDRKLPRRIIDNKNFTYRIIISVLDKFCKSNEVLDVGSGVGTLDFYLTKQGKRVTGFEISGRAIKVAKESIKKFKLEDKIEFKGIDFYKTKVNKKYPFVICSEVLEHLPNDKLALKKIAEFTKKDGLLMLTVPSANAPLPKKTIKAFDKRSGHLRRYTMESLQKLLLKSGFKPIYEQKSEGIIRNSLFVFRLDTIIRISNRFSWVSDFITFLDEISLKIFGESQLIVIAKKR